MNLFDKICLERNGREWKYLLGKWREDREENKMNRNKTEIGERIYDKINS